MRVLARRIRGMGRRSEPDGPAFAAPATGFYGIASPSFLQHNAVVSNAVWLFLWIAYREPRLS
jgi:hypothetical protein